MSAACLTPLVPLDRATAMNMTNVLVISIVGLTIAKTTQLGKLTVARRNPAF